MKIYSQWNSKLKCAVNIKYIPDFEDLGKKRVCPTAERTLTYIQASQYEGQLPVNYSRNQSMWLIILY